MPGICFKLIYGLAVRSGWINKSVYKLTVVEAEWLLYWVFSTFKSLHFSMANYFNTKKIGSETMCGWWDNV